jgi:hypothetical protein
MVIIKMNRLYQNVKNYIGSGAIDTMAASSKRIGEPQFSL